MRDKGICSRDSGDVCQVYGYCITAVMRIMDGRGDGARSGFRDHV
jgi:hypothetical protein